MLDHLRGGRLEIGLARGSNPAEKSRKSAFAWRRAAAVLEALDIARGRADRDGPQLRRAFYKCHNLTVGNTRTCSSRYTRAGFRGVAEKLCVGRPARVTRVRGLYLSIESTRILMSTVRPRQPPAARSVSDDLVSFDTHLDEDGDCGPRRVSKRSFRADYRESGRSRGRCRIGSR